MIELLAYFREPEPGQPVRAVPGAGLEVPIWILGRACSARSWRRARPAVRVRLALRAGELIERWTCTAAFKPSRSWPRPYVMLGVNVVAADTDDEARFLASSGRQAFASLRAGRPTSCRRRRRMGARPAEPEDPLESQRCRLSARPATVGGAGATFVARTGADELIVVAQIYDHEARLRSYEIAMAARPD